MYRLTGALPGSREWTRCFVSTYESGHSCHEAELQDLRVPKRELGNQRAYIVTGGDATMAGVQVASSAMLTLFNLSPR